MRLSREQIARLQHELSVLHPNAVEIFIGGESDVIVVALIADDGEPFYKFELTPDGEVSRERRL